jgi:hypothetical protein
MGSTPSIRCNRCKCNVPEDMRYTHQCPSAYEEFKNNQESVRRNNQHHTLNKNSDLRLCKFCKKHIAAIEYEDHILCHNLNNDVESDYQEIVTNNGSRYKVIYSINVRNGSSNRNPRANRIEISVPGSTTVFNNGTNQLNNINTTRNQLEQLNSIRNITNILRQRK